MNELLKKSLENMPEFLTTQHLVELGIFVNLDAAYFARYRRRSPNYIKLAGKILYPKSSLIEFLEKRFIHGNELADDKDDETRFLL